MLIVMSFKICYYKAKKIILMKLMPTGIYIMTEKHKKNLSKSMKGNTNGRGNKDNKLSEQHKQKMSEANEGQSFSEERKRKISEALKGIKRSDETRKKISLAKKGKKQSEEHKRKTSLVHKGKTISIEVRKKIGLANKGEKCHFWKGDKMKDYPLLEQIRKSSEYNQWRIAVYQRDNYKCQMVGGCPDKKSNRLEANHIKRFIDYPELRL